MILYPAIDLLDGQVVRLLEGDFEQKTVFSCEPVELLADFANAGVQFVHLVDLSGARNPQKRQTALVKNLLRENVLKAQIGGGIRTLPEIGDLLDAGAERVVLGSLIVTEPDLALAALKRFGPHQLTFALDVRLSETEEPIVMSHGWAKSSGLSFAHVVKPFAAKGLKRVLCTDISVDGRLTGPNVNLYKRLQKEFPELEIEASGGVSKLEDLQTLSKAGIHSVIVGRALLNGTFSVKEALAYAE